MIISISQAVDALKIGKTIAYPTEAIYGLGCNPFDKQAVDNLLTIKNRSVAKGLIIVAANIEQIKYLVKLEEQNWSKKIIESWQDKNKAITWIVPTTNKAPNWLTGGRKTLAVRVTYHSVIKELCALLNSPIVSTSANLSKQEPATSQKQCLQMFPNIPILKGETLGLNQPSQIWDARTMQQLR